MDEQLAGSPAGKPNASAQAGRVEPKPDSSLHVSRELAAALPLASLALEVLAIICEISFDLQPFGFVSLAIRS